MRIDIAKIMSKPDNIVSTNTSIGFSYINYMGEDYKVTKSSGVDVTITNLGKKRVHIVLKTSLCLNISCSRCLSDVPVSFDIEFDDEIKFNNEGKAFTKDKDEANYIDEFILDTDSLIKEEVFLNFPGQVLCRPDCKGLCPVCGINLNSGFCSCNTESLDPRMARIRDIFNNYKEV